MRCYYTFSDEENNYFVMEFLGGRDANTLIKNYDLNDGVVKLLIAEISIALDYIHNLNIYHKDIKPENILISNTVSNLVFNIIRGTLN